MASSPRILSLGLAHPAHVYRQDWLRDRFRERVLGLDWRQRPEAAEQGRQIERLFEATRVRTRQTVVDLLDYYARPRSIGERMATYAAEAPGLGRTALEACLRGAADWVRPPDIGDFFAVSCTGYMSPGLDILLARDLGMAPDARRVSIGHMGCFGALVGLRQSLAAVRAHPGSAAALLCVELASMHFAETLDIEVMTSFALFGDAAAAAIIADNPKASGPELVDTYTFTDFAAAGQMSWTITDAGFVMGLSPRVPVTLRRAVRGAVECLLAPQGLTVEDVRHWIIHPGGPAILEAIAGKLELSEEQMAPSWEVLAEHGNCSSPTVLLILDKLMRSGHTRTGEWCVMMAFGPGLTLETALLRF